MVIKCNEAFEIKAKLYTNLVPSALPHLFVVVEQLHFAAVESNQGHLLNAFTKCIF